MAQLIQQLTSFSTRRVAGAGAVTAPANVASVDCQAFTGPLNFLISVGTVSAAATLTGVVQESDDNVTFAANDNQPFTVLTANATGLFVVFAPSFAKRFARIAWTAITGTSPSFAVESVVLVAQPKTTSTSNTASTAVGTV